MSAALSSLFFVAALAFAMTIGPQTRPWTWGPAMVCLGLALVCGLRSRMREDIRIPGPVLLALSCITAAWIITRALISPVPELARADLLLLAAAIGAFCWMRTIDGHTMAQRLFHWGIAGLLLANLAVMYYQWKEPGFTPLFHSKPVEKALTGFFTHYIETANFLVVTSMWTAAAAVWGPHNRLTKSLFLLVAAAGLAGVALSGGRGGVAGGATACAVFFVIMLMQAKKQNARWFAPAVIAVPILAALAAAYLVFGWQTAQKARGIKNSEDLVKLLDNNARLYALGIAWECIAEHPLTGGGSRSFSWESYRFSDPKEFGNMTTARLEYVHNEFLQAASDYGIVGAVLTTTLLICFGLTCVLRTLFSPANAPPDPSNALRLGGLAALAGLIAQSCFAFIFHLIPGALMLGAALGMVAHHRLHVSDIRSKLPTRLLMAIPATAAMIALLWSGFLGSMATLAIWDSEYGKSRQLFEGIRIENLGKALKWWPDSSLFNQRGVLHQQKISEPLDEDSMQNAHAAIADYQQAALLHPFEPAHPVNTGIILSLLGMDDEAQESFEEAIILQAKQEPAFRAHFSYAGHHLRRGLRMSQADKPQDAAEAMEQAATQIEIASKKMHWNGKEMNEFRVTIYENLGMVRERLGDNSEARKAYETAAASNLGKHAHYRLAMLFGKIGQKLWQDREPDRALGMFVSARHSIDQAQNHLPASITTEQRQEFIAYLDKTIAFLKGAKVEPVW